MGRNVKVSANEEDELNNYSSYLVNKENYSKRLNVNDLIQRRKEEKVVDKKNNIIIVSAIAAVATATFAIISIY